MPGNPQNARSDAPLAESARSQPKPRGENAALTARVIVKRSGHGETFNLDADIEIPPGITILTGHSGSGKTTLLQSIAGILRPNRGRVALGSAVWFDDTERIDVPIEKRKIAYVFQSLALFPHRTAAANVAYGIDSSVPRAARREIAMSLLSRLGVEHLADRRPRTYSGGEAQRVALARALAISPQAILLDEPFSALDQDLRSQLTRLVRDIVDELAIPLLHVTHHFGEANETSDWFIRLTNGRISDRGEARNLR